VTTYLLSQEGRQCRIYAAWWTPDGEETTGVVLLPDRQVASRLATSLGLLSEAVWGQEAAAPGEPLPISPVLASLAAGESAPPPVPAGGPVSPGGPMSPGGPVRPGGPVPAAASRLRARIADDEARTIVELVAGLSDETVRQVRDEIGSDLTAAAMSTPSPLGASDRRWQRFERLDPAGFLALWANDDDPNAPFLAWAIGRPVRAFTDRGTGAVTHHVDFGEGIEVRITPDAVGDDPVLRMDMQCEGETRAYLDIDDVGDYGHAGSLLAEIRERLTPQYLVDAVVRTEATYRPVPSDEDLAAFDQVVRRLMVLLPPGDPEPT